MSRTLATGRRRADPETELRPRHVHTWLPRQLVTFGLFEALLMPLALYLMDDDDHIGFDKGRLVVDSVGRQSLRVVLLLGLVAALVGWLLWIIAAAMNARGRSRWSISPLSMPMAYVFVGGLVAAAASLTENFTNEYTAQAIGVVIGVGVVCHLGVVAAFRRAANTIGAPEAPWTNMMVLPPMIAGSVAVGSFFTKAVSTQNSYLVLTAVVFLLLLMMVASWARAMATFDRSCVGRQMTHENMELPAFLRAG